MRTIGFYLLLIFSLVQLKESQAQAKPVEESNGQDSLKTDPFRKRAYIGLEYGFSIPMGSFSADTEAQNKSAFALNGRSFNILKFAYRIRSSFYACGRYAIMQNQVQESGIESRLASQSASRFQVEAKSYELRAFFLGVGVTKRSKSLDVDLRFLGGYGNTFTPSLQITETDSNGLKTQRALPTENQSGFGGALSMGLRIHLNEYLDFTSTASYLIFEKNFEDVSLNPTQSSRLSYEVVNLNFGIAYRFIPEKLSP
ncbi:MAG: hypothetical protein RIC95_05180 [Vicingaceae bacterium]